MHASITPTAMHRIPDACPAGMCARLATCADFLCPGHPLGAAAQLNDLEAAAAAARAGQVFVPLNKIDDFRTEDGGKQIDTEEPMSDIAAALVLGAITLVALGAAAAVIFN